MERTTQPTTPSTAVDELSFLLESQLLVSTNEQAPTTSSAIQQPTAMTPRQALVMNRVFFHAKGVLDSQARAWQSGVCSWFDAPMMVAKLHLDRMRCRRPELSLTDLLKYALQFRDALWALAHHSAFEAHAEDMFDATTVLIDLKHRMALLVEAEMAREAAMQGV